MAVVFEYLHLKWFLSLGDCDPLPLIGLGPVLILGENCDEPGAQSNEAGKTALLEGPAWVFWGQSLRYGARPGDSVCHVQTPAGDGTYGQLQFTVDDQRYRVTRTRHHPSLGSEVYLERHEDGGDVWEDLRGHDGDATTDRISRLLGFDFETFWYAVGFAQGSTYRFAQTADKSSASAKALIAKILQFDVIDAAVAAVRKDLRQRVIPALSALEGRHVEVASVLENMREELEAARSVSDSPESVSRRDQILDLQRRLLRPTAAKYSLQELDRLTREAIEMKQQLRAESHVQDQERERVVERVRLLTHVLDTHQARRGQPCERCGQTLSVEAVERLRDQDARVLVNERTALVNVSRLLRKTQKQLEGAENGLAHYAQESAKALSVLEDLETLEAELARLQGADEQVVEISVKTVKRLAKSVEDYEQRLAEIEDQQQQLQMVETVATLSLDLFQGLKVYLLDEARPVLNYEANRALRTLTDGTTRVEFGEGLEFSVLSDSDIPYRGRSQGWKRRIDLAVGYAVQRLVAMRHGQAL